jgi:hypothetical protein
MLSLRKLLTLNDFPAAIVPNCFPYQPALRGQCFPQKSKTMKSNPHPGSVVPSRFAYWSRRSQTKADCVSRPPHVGIVHALFHLGRPQPRGHTSRGWSASYNRTVMSSVDFRWLSKPFVLKETGPAFADLARISSAPPRPDPAFPGFLPHFTDLPRRSQTKAGHVSRPPHFENSKQFQSDSKRFKPIQTKNTTPLADTCARPAPHQPSAMPHGHEPTSYTTIYDHLRLSTTIYDLKNHGLHATGAHCSPCFPACYCLGLT